MDACLEMLAATGVRDVWEDEEEAPGRRDAVSHSYLRLNLHILMPYFIQPSNHQ